MLDAIPDFEVDGLYRLDTESTRRKFLGVLATFGAGLAGLRKATERAFGEKPDGVPLVWRYDRFGNPETVRYVPRERRRRIRVYYNLHPDTVYEQTEGVNGFTLEQRSADPTDLALKVYVDENTRTVRRNLANRVQQVPVVVEERHIDPTPARVCDRRAQDFYDPLPANPRSKLSIATATNTTTAR